jgi:hypothetical protein
VYGLLAGWGRCPGTAMTMSPQAASRPCSALQAFRQLLSSWRCGGPLLFTYSLTRTASLRLPSSPSNTERSGRSLPTASPPSHHMRVDITSARVRRGAFVAEHGRQPLKAEIPLAQLREQLRSSQAAGGRSVGGGADSTVSTVSMAPAADPTLTLLPEGEAPQKESEPDEEFELVLVPPKPAAVSDQQQQQQRRRRRKLEAQKELERVVTSSTLQSKLSSPSLAASFGCAVHCLAYMQPASPRLLASIGAQPAAEPHCAQRSLLCMCARWRGLARQVKEGELERFNELIGAEGGEHRGGASIFDAIHPG